MDNKMTSQRPLIRKYQQQADVEYSRLMRSSLERGYKYYRVQHLLQFKYSDMGNSNSQEASFVLDAKSLQDWTKIQEQGFCQLWMHKKTQKQLQAYPIPESFARNQDQLRKYNLRKNNCNHLVSVEAIVTPGDGFLCSEPRTAYALVENINCRLRQYKRCLHFPQALYILTAAAAGYNTLNSFFGPIEPHPDMICFNQEGHVKVWLNENLSLNEPSLTARPPYSPSDDYNVAQKRTKEGVDKLVRIVEASSLEGFPPQFTEECKTMSTYFEIVNKVSYYCQKNEIQLPERVQVPVKFQNPVFRPRRELMKDQSMPLLHDQSIQKLDVSRVKTVAVGSSQIIHNNNNSQQRTFDRQWTMYKTADQGGLNRMSSQQSPKITFSIRASLPAPIQSNQQSPIKAIMREAGIPPIIPKRTTQIGFGQITPPHQNVVMQKVERKSNKSEEQIKPTETVEPRQVTELTFTQAAPVKSLPNAQVQPEKASVDESLKTKEFSLEVSEVPQKELLGEQNQVIETMNQQLLQQSYEQQNSMTGPHEEESSQPQEVIPVSQVNSDNQIPGGSRNGSLKREEIHFYNHEQYERQILTSELQVPSYKSSQKNIEAPAVERLNFMKQAQNSKNSQFSSAEPYVPPGYYNMDSPIIEQQEENFSSPRKNNSDIQEWEAKLTKFTNSKHSEHRENKRENSYPNDYQEDEKEVLQPKKVETDREPTVMIVGPPREEPEVNELANLQVEDIEQYIRAKYNLGKKEVQPPTERSIPSVGFTKIQSIYQRVPKADYQADYQGSSYNNYSSSNDYVSDYKTTSYKNQYEFDNPAQYDYNYTPYAFNQPAKDPTYQYTFKKYAEKLDYGNIEKQNYRPLCNFNNQPYQPSDRVSIQLSQDTGSYRTSLPSFAVEEKIAKKETQRYRYRNSDTSKIEERYNKYVVNGPRRASNKASRMSNQKDVSLLLSEDKDISGISPKHVPSELNESSKRGINDFIVGDHSRQGVTYQKLRTLLWED